MRNLAPAAPVKVPFLRWLAPCPLVIPAPLVAPQLFYLVGFYITNLYGK